jgi:hypothetical protein
MSLCDLVKCYYNGEEKQQVYCTIQIISNLLHGKKKCNQAAAHQFCVEYFINTAVVYSTFRCEEGSVIILDSQ